jgi:hypothetical protein
MSIVLLDRVGATAYSPSSPLGTGALLLSTDLTTYQSPANIGNGNQFYYLARHRTADQWEVGTGTIDATGPFPYLVRAAGGVFDGSSGTAALVDFSAGYVDVISCYPAALLVNPTAIINVSAGLVAAVSLGDFVGRTLTGSSDVSILNGTGVSGDPTVFLEPTGISAGDYGSGTQVPSLTISAAGRIVSVSLADIPAATSIEASVSSYLGINRTGDTASIYLIVDQLDSRYDAAGAAVSVQAVALAAAASVEAVAGASIANTNAALTSVTAVLGTSIDNTNAALTSVTAVLGTSIANTNAALTSVAGAAARLAARNVFTSTNEFQGNVSASSAAFNGPVYVSAGTWTPLWRLTDGTSIPIDMSKSNQFYVTLGGNRAVEAPTNVQPGQSGIIYIHQDAAGSRNLNWASAWKWPAGTTVSLTATGSATDVVAFGVRTSGFVVANASKDYR